MTSVANAVKKVELKETPFNDWKIRTSKSCIMTQAQEEKYVNEITPVIFIISTYAILFFSEFQPN